MKDEESVVSMMTDFWFPEAGHVFGLRQFRLPP
jgi:hypothetical protein